MGRGLLWGIMASVAFGQRLPLTGVRWVGYLCIVGDWGKARLWRLGGGMAAPLAVGMLVNIGYF